MAKDPGDQLDGPPRSNSRHHYREEVGLETGHKVARPDRVPEPLRKGMENLVSGGSVETFVQVPEVIQIQLHHQAVAGLPGGILGKRFDKAAPAQEAGRSSLCVCRYSSLWMARRRARSRKTPRTATARPLGSCTGTVEIATGTRSPFL